MSSAIDGFSYTGSNHLTGPVKQKAHSMRSAGDGQALEPNRTMQMSPEKEAAEAQPWTRERMENTMPIPWYAGTQKALQTDKAPEAVNLPDENPTAGAAIKTTAVERNRGVDPIQIQKWIRERMENTMPIQWYTGTKDENLLFSGASIRVKG